MHVWLIGMMGSGKSSVGKILAAKWGARSVDLDREIERATGSSIAGIFQRSGETAFRTIETRHLARIAASRDASVIATGGGAILSDENVAAMRDSGRVVWLDAPVAALARRVAKDRSRPLLAGSAAKPAATLKKILAQRKARYADAADLRVDAGTGNAKAVALRVADALARGNAPISYRVRGVETRIHVEDGAIDRAGVLVREALGEGARAVVVTDSVVGPLHARRLVRSLEKSGYDVDVLTIPSGERHKTAAAIVSLWNALAAAGVDRRTPVIALGGGVVGDVAGFAAATILRGVPVVQVPTTLVAMVDSAIGGKTGFDLAAGKNLVGAFKQPAVVIADPRTLATLPLPELRAGMAEVVKYGVILDADFFASLESMAWPAGAASLERIVRRCAELKAGVVERDPEERGERAILNFGHTAGHAIETAARFRRRHGEAVAVGMVAEAELARSMRRCSPGDVRRLRSLLERFALPVAAPRGYAKHLGADKKRVGREIRIPLLLEIGRVRIESLGIKTLQRSFQ